MRGFGRELVLFLQLGTKELEEMKHRSFYYGSCLLFAGIVLGITLGFAISGKTADYPLSNTVVCVMTTAFIIGIFIDWTDRYRQV